MTPTNAHEGPERVMERLSALVEQMLAKAEGPVEGIGFGFPGLLDRPRGAVARWVYGGKVWSGFPLVSFLQERFSLPVAVDNDANCAALAEALYGKAKGARTLLFVILGTGVGGGIIVDQKIFAGKGNAGEIGHVTVEVDGIPCGCGARGCLERYVCKSAIEQAAKHILGRELDPNEVATLAEQGHAQARQVLREIARYLAVGLVNCVNVLDPDLIVLGGGLANSRLLVEYTRDALANAQYLPVPPIEVSELGDDAGLVGAAALLRP